MFKSERTIIVCCVVLILASLANLMFLRSHIAAWERRHGYPYGQMCNSVFTLWVDTCKRADEQEWRKLWTQ